MKLEDILAEWDKDSHVDRTKLDSVALDIPKVHAKYIRILSHERLVLAKQEAEYKQLKFDRYEFYTEGPNETTPKEWLEDVPARGRIIKTDVGRYMEADRLIIALTLKMGLQKEKIEALKSIIDIISRMGYQVRTAVDYMRFMNGT
jgi:hypothetical protein